jgi:hypothetical protein
MHLRMTTRVDLAPSLARVEAGVRGCVRSSRRLLGARFAVGAMVGVAGTLVFFAPSAGAASRWTRPQSFAGATGSDSSGTSAGIAADGTSAAAWTIGTRLLLSPGTSQGSFARARVIGHDPGRAGGLSVAVARGGAFAVAWSSATDVRVAVRRASGDPVVVRVIGPLPGEVQVAADPRGGWVLVTSDTTGVKGFSLDPAGRPLGQAQDLGVGAGHFDRQALAVDPHGRAFFTFTGPGVPLLAGSPFLSPGAVLVATRPHGGRFGDAVALPGRVEHPQLAVDSDGRAVIAVTRDGNCTEVGVCFGLPGVSLLPQTGVPGSAFGPPLDHPRRAFSPTAAPTRSGGGVLVFALKTRPSPFSAQAPLAAVTFDAGGRVGPLQTLTSARASFPFLGSLSRGRALVVWAGSRGLGAALAGSNGEFQATSAPVGKSPIPYGDSTRDLSTAGRYALFAWQEAKARRVLISVRRF